MRRHRNDQLFWFQISYPSPLFYLCIKPILFYLLVPASYGGVFNADPRYALWPNPARIPYKIDIANNNVQDVLTLRSAMNQINSDTGGCISFVPYNAVTDRNADFVLFRNQLTAGLVDICYTFPGLVTNNGFGQVAVIFSTTTYPGSTPVSNRPGPGLPGACLDNQRETMRLLMNLLGVRSEHNRNDRATFLTFQSSDPNSLVVSPLNRYNLFDVYNASRPVTIASTFDYQSITLVTGDKFSASANAPVFIPVAPNTIGQLSRLSRTDCLVINLLYRCNAPCPDPYATSGIVTFNSPTTFSKHIYCPPLTGSTVLVTPIIVGDVTVANAPGVSFRYTLTPQANNLVLQAVNINFVNVNTPAARILLTQLPTRGFVNAQFTLTATAVGGTLTGSTTVTLTINCVPQFVSSSGGRPNFIQPSLISQPTTLPDAGVRTGVAFAVTVGDNTHPGLYINCRSPDIILPSTLGFVTATDPEGGRISYHVTAPFNDDIINRGYGVTQDGVITLNDNLGGAEFGGAFNLAPFESVSYTNNFVEQDQVYIAAVDPAGGMSVIHYTVFFQCGPPG